MQMCGQMTKIYCNGSTKKSCVVIEEKGIILSPYSELTTTNVGEYKAVIRALMEALRYNFKTTEVLTDSLLVVNQINGLWQCKKPHLLPFLRRARELVEKLNAKVVWTPREENLAGKILERR